jgi:hypothetical protein
MRMLLFGLVAIAVLQLGGTGVGNAQAASSYPWCAVYDYSTGIGGTRSCYYTSQRQCLTTMSGIGGYCVTNPAFRPARPRNERR